MSVSKYRCCPNVGVNLAMTLTQWHLHDGSRTLGSWAVGMSLEGSLWLILSRILIFSSCSALNPPSFIKISQVKKKKKISQVLKTSSLVFLGTVKLTPFLVPGVEYVTRLANQSFTSLNLKAWFRDSEMARTKPIRTNKCLTTSSSFSFFHSFFFFFNFKRRKDFPV